MKKGLLFVIVLVGALIINVAYAAVSPAIIELTGDPGQEIKSSIILINNSEEQEGYLVKIGSINYDENGERQFLEEGDTIPNYSTQSWITAEKNTFTVAAGDQVEVPLTIKIPEDAQPGIHLGAIFVSGINPNQKETAGTGVQLTGRAAIINKITVSGESEEILKLENFKLNEDKFKKGIFEFITTIKNEGQIGSSPLGTIKIYDSNNQQVLGIIRTTQEINGEKIVTGLKDEIPFNDDQLLIMPNVKRELSQKVDDIILKKGAYTAKLVAYYGLGASQKKLEGEFNFTLSEDLAVKNFSAKDYFNSNLPVSFNGTITNNGSVELATNIELVIKNIFNSTKETIKLDPILTKIPSGGSYVLPASLQWANGFALGYYTATLNVTYGSNSISSTIGFWVINWWQILIIVAVIAVVVFGIIKFSLQYRKMKKKLKEKE